MRPVGPSSGARGGNGWLSFQISPLAQYSRLVFIYVRERDRAATEASGGVAPLLQGGSAIAGGVLTSGMDGYE
jgi:hypothetical protein